MWMGTRDKLVIDIALETSRDIPLEFFICRKRDQKSRMKSLEYITKFVKPSNAKNYRLTEK